MKFQQNYEKKTLNNFNYTKKKKIKLLNINTPGNFSILASGKILKTFNKDTVEKTPLNSISKINNVEIISFSKNNSLTPTETKVLIYPRESINQSNLISNDSKNKKHKNSTRNSNQKDIKENLLEERTEKIDYRYYCYYPIKRVLSSFDSQRGEKYYWFATYDKLIKKKKLLKIFNFYDVTFKTSLKSGRESYYNNSSEIKEIKMIIDNYELYFIKKHKKPCIRRKEGKNIYTKLYLLTLNQINMIFSYVNRIEYKAYINDIDYFYEKDSYKKIFENRNKGEYNDINYSIIYCLGSYMNINIYCFSKSEDEEEMLNNYNIDIENYPSSKKIAKLIKYLMISFPEYSKQHFINYIFNDNHSTKINNKALIDKKKEVSNLLLSQKKSLYKPYSKSNSIIRNTISSIPQVSYSHYFSSNTLKNNSNSANITNKNNYSNNNLATISNKPSCFDFTTDFINSLRQNDETISKGLDSITSLFNQNTNRNEKSKFVYKNYAPNKSGRNKNDAIISNFSFEIDSKNKQTFIENNNRENDKLKNNNFNHKNKIINNKDVKSKKMSYLIQPKKKKITNSKISYNKKSILSSKNNSAKVSNDFSLNNKIHIEDNKENYNYNYSISNIFESKNKKKNKINSLDFTTSQIKKSKKKIKPLKNRVFNSNMNINISSSKSLFKGEDIFMNKNNQSLKSISGNKNNQSSLKSSEYRIIRKNQRFRLSENLSIFNRLNKK